MNKTSYISPTEAVPFSVLAAIARMAHKYQVDWLLEEATRRLKTAFSDKFTMWPRDLSTSAVTVNGEDAVEAFNLFSRINLPDMLPAALYACCQLDLTYLVHGVLGANNAIVEKLDTDDLERCLTARRLLQERNVKLALTLFRDPSPTCQTQTCVDVCGDFTVTDMEEYYFVADANILGPHFLESIEMFLGDNDALCEDCARGLRDKELAARLAAWRNLPGYAGVHVEGWGSA